jgi:hypothetical protein
MLLVDDYTKMTAVFFLKNKCHIPTKVTKNFVFSSRDKIFESLRSLVHAPLATLELEGQGSRLLFLLMPIPKMRHGYGSSLTSAFYI